MFCYNVFGERHMNYLICSSSYRLIQEELEKIIKEGVPYTKYDLLFDSLDNILEEASYYSFFEEEKYIVIKNADCFTSTKIKIEEEKLIHYLNEPNPNTTLIFVTNNKLDERKKITAMFKDKYNVITIKTPTIKEIYAKIEEKLKKEKFSIDSKSLYYVINSSLNNYDLTYNNIEKIKLYYMDQTKKHITYDTVVALTSVSTEENNFKFIEYVLNKQIKEAIACLHDLLLNKVEPLSLLNLLFREYKIMLQVYACDKKKKTKKEIAKELHLQDWQVEKYRKQNYNYREEELENYLKKLLEIDFQIKRNKIKKQLALELFILAL